MAKRLIPSTRQTLNRRCLQPFLLSLHRKDQTLPISLRSVVFLRRVDDARNLRRRAIDRDRTGSKPTLGNKRLFRHRMGDRCSVRSSVVGRRRSGSTSCRRGQQAESWWRENNLRPESGLRDESQTERSILRDSDNRQRQPLQTKHPSTASSDVAKRLRAAPMPLLETRDANTDRNAHCPSILKYCASNADAQSTWARWVYSRVTGTPHRSCQIWLFCELAVERAVSLDREMSYPTATSIEFCVLRFAGLSRRRLIGDKRYN